MIHTRAFMPHKILLYISQGTDQNHMLDGEKVTLRVNAREHSEQEKGRAVGGIVSLPVRPTGISPLNFQPEINTTKPDVLCKARTGI